MSAPQSHADAEKHRRLVREANRYTYGFLTAALFVAVVGAALVAALLRVPGVPFVTRWLVLVLVIVLPGLTVTWWRTWRGR